MVCVCTCVCVCPSGGWGPVLLSRRLKISTGFSETSFCMEVDAKTHTHIYICIYIYTLSQQRLRCKQLYFSSTNQACVYVISDANSAGQDLGGDASEDPALLAALPPDAPPDSMAHKKVTWREEKRRIHTLMEKCNEHVDILSRLNAHRACKWIRCERSST